MSEFALQMRQISKSYGEVRANNSINFSVQKGTIHALAGEKQERVRLAAQRVVGDLGIPGVKHSMDLNGYYGGPSRLPFLPLSGEQKAEIEKLMAGIKS